jgi:hypothetical protein
MRAVADGWHEDIASRRLKRLDARSGSSKPRACEDPGFGAFGFGVLGCVLAFESVGTAHG